MAIKFFVTDHSPDSSETGSWVSLLALYTELKRHGITSVRYDWRWKIVEPQQGVFDEEALDRYGVAIKAMQEAGLGAPTVILSNIPDWALRLYKKDKQSFFEHYSRYANKVRHELKFQSVRIERVQILNEINVRLYTPIEPQDIKELCRLTLEAFGNYNPNLQLIGSLLVNNLTKYLSRWWGIDIFEYLNKHEDVLRCFNEISLDYYPGMWHVPVVERWLNGGWMFAQLALLSEVITGLCVMGFAYNIGEVGLPTNVPWRTPAYNEARQRHFFSRFFREFKHMLHDLELRRGSLPSHVGIYEAMDEPAKGGIGKLLERLGHPEHHFGMMYADGKRKEILKGSRHQDDRKDELCTSQLAKIIRYTNTPLRGFFQRWS